MSGTRWWELLPADARDAADANVLRDAPLLAVKAVWEAGRPHGMSLVDAQAVVDDRYRHHGERVVPVPDDPLDVESLAARASAAPGRVVAIEAVWDGDTVHDWFVDLLAVTTDCPAGHRLATVYWQAAVRYLGAGRGPRHPSAAAAERAGRALAAHLAVPFRFASPDSPGD
ncbi:hypothetical protein BJP40_13780 [Streptomyces sp. CC53]|uniref:hypothetical protein n=1 Tax=unclassified Streptomyces TaxID=2593676 RepID=UPI0008DE5EFC|nr:MULTISPECIES: hypothetical protein [unclassified Streptomyces]OII66295.1 hypothetical protein BJP40_13780 [Streptomyces sp. CC53]